MVEVRGKVLLGRIYKIKERSVSVDFFLTFPLLIPHISLASSLILSSLLSHLLFLTLPLPLLLNGSPHIGATTIEIGGDCIVPQLFAHYIIVSQGL